MKNLTSLLISSLLVFSAAACQNPPKTSETAPNATNVAATAPDNGDATDKAARDIASEVRSKLEANIPNGQLTVDASRDGTVTVVGTVPVADQLKKIDRLTREIKGVKNVIVKATVAPPKS